MPNEPRHKQVEIKIGDELFEVDERIAPLVKAVNRSGYPPTIYSCQGEDYDIKGGGYYVSAYVMWGDTDWENMAHFIFEVVLPIVKSVIPEPGFVVDVRYCKHLIRASMSFIPSATEALAEAFNNVSIET